MMIKFETWSWKFNYIIWISRKIENTPLKIIYPPIHISIFKGKFELQSHDGLVQSYQEKNCHQRQIEWKEKVVEILFIKDCTGELCSRRCPGQVNWQDTGRATQGPRLHFTNHCHFQQLAGRGTLAGTDLEIVPVALAQCYGDPRLQGSTEQLEHLRLRGSNTESIECI